MENMTPRPRYYALNEAMNTLRGGPWRLHVKGLDELTLDPLEREDQGGPLGLGQQGVDDRDACEEVLARVVG